MTDTTQPSQETDKKLPEKTNGDADNGHRQDTFDELFQQLTDQFGAFCEKANFGTAILIVENQNEKQPPAVFIRGHIVEAATITADFLRRVKTQLYKNLDTEPR